MTGFVWPVRVYYEDTDAAGVVFYANYLRFMERARTEWLRSLGFEQDRLMRDSGIVFAVRRVDLRFHRPARFNDALLVDVALGRVGGASLEFEQRVVRDDADQELFCSARVNVACLDAATFRPRPLPELIAAEIPHEC